MHPKQLDSESDKAYAAFCQYIDAGPQRGLRELARNLGKSSTVVCQWSARHKWQKRMKAMEAENRRALAEAEAKALQESAEAWIKRTASFREEAWKRTQKLLDKAMQMLDFPLAKKTVSEDGRTTTIMPTRWTQGDVVQILKHVETTQRMLLNLPTERTEITGPEGGPVPAMVARVVIELPDNGRDGKPSDG